MAEKNNANIGFEKQIWDAACELWGHIPAADYRKVIVYIIKDMLTLLKVFYIYCHNVLFFHNLSFFTFCCHFFRATASPPKNGHKKYTSP